MTTARTIVTNALEDIGVISSGETLDADDANLAFRRLNRMVDSFANESLLTYSTVWQSFSLSTISKTIGVGGQVNVARPIRITRGGYVRVDGVDRELEVLDRDQYAEIRTKTATAQWPESVHYDGGFPIGTLYFYPVPQSAVTVKLPCAVQLDQFADLDTEYDLPQGYQRFLELALAEELSIPFRVPISPDLRAAAAKARAQVKRANSKVPQLFLLPKEEVRDIATSVVEEEEPTGEDTTYVATDYVVTDYVV